MIAGLYHAASALAGPLIDVYLGSRLRHGKEDPLRFAERLGKTDAPRPEGPLVWMHGASVGESLSMLPAIERMRAHPAKPAILVTTGTVTSAKLMTERLPQGVLHQFVPIDRPDCVGRFLDHWRPDLALWWESELWPNLVLETKSRGVPMILANARMSPRSFRNWRWFPGFARTLLAAFDLVLTQSDIDTERFRTLGGNAETIGNLKFAVPPLPADPNALADVRDAVGTRPVWLAASTHEGEEEAAWAVHRKLTARHKDLLTVIVPRHAVRGTAVADMLTREGARVARRSAGQTVSAGTDVYLADTMGELGLFFRAAPIVFMGKSLVPEGGQNPIEPAKLGAAILTGPHTWNFEKIVADLKATGGIRVVADTGELAAALEDDLTDPARRAARADAAKRFADDASDVLDTFMAKIEHELAAVTTRRMAHARP